MHLKASSSVGRRGSRARPITVHFPIPKKAISTLRALAIGKDPRLVDLGVLAVQISDDESIVLGIELEKAKRRDRGIPNNVSAPSSNALYKLTTNSSRTVVGFESAARNLASSSTAGFYANHCVTTTARNEALSSKAKKPLTTAAKKKAKETLNAARRGSSRAKGKAGKGGQLSAAAVRASTWEMVYSHIGLPGDNRRNQTNPPYIEPTVASLASGIAYVPVAQPRLPRENTSKAESRRREASASSPPHKSPGNSALYSEDDSSVSSSPCSHSPMNEEELLNLFVDSNFSATSILKQLAESRVKEDVKNSDKLENGGKQINPNHWSNWNPETSGLSSTTTSSHDDKSRTESSVNGVQAQVTSSTISSRGGLKHINFNPPSAACTSTTNALIKRPSSLLSFSGESLSNLYGSPAKRQRRSFAELEIKREMVDLSSKVFEKELQKVAGASTGTSNRPSMQLHEAMSPTTADQSSTSTKSQNTALRNYNQYGYYYSSEDLKALGSKALASKALGKAVPSSKTNKGENLGTFANTGIDAKPTSSANQHSQVASDGKLMHPNDSSSSVSTDAVNQGSNTPPLQSCSFKEQSGSVGGSNNSNLKTGVIHNSGSVDDCVSSTDDIVVVAVTSSQPSSSAAGSKSLAIAPTASSPALSTSSDTKQPDNTSSDSKGGLRKSGQCYALSYVYPMGTVWYPYVAITPYAVLGSTQKDGTEIINDDKDQENATKGLSTYSSAQWQRKRQQRKNKEKKIK
ncbi:hypothetical protein QZH41_000289 [Actinostola sp. cb2023]|nr:hypothetical protein QZH41_000289 [Actinostola sp. cb2023]